IRQADAEYWATARKLSGLLLGPAASRLGKKRLLIVGEGALHYLPFGALPEPGADTPLMVNHEMVTAPSASMVAVLPQGAAGRKPATKALAVLADAVFYADDVRIAATNRAALRTGSEPVTQEFLRLRFSRTEAEEITRLAGAAGTLKALDFEA